MEDIRILGDVQKLSLKDGDTVVLLTDRLLTQEQVQRITNSLLSTFPRNKAVVMQDGMKLGVMGNDDRLDRIEQKLDLLIAALAEDQEDQEQGFDLEGNELGKERDDTQSLG